jgi:hypothetical protein
MPAYGGVGIGGGRERYCGDDRRRPHAAAAFGVPRWSSRRSPPVGTEFGQLVGTRAHDGRSTRSIDILGLNDISRLVFDNVAPPLPAWCSPDAWPVGPAPETAGRTVAVTMLGNTTRR